MREKGILKTVIGILALFFIVMIPSVNVSAANPTDTWINHAASAFAGGNGTKENPYQISSAEELAYLATEANFEGGSRTKDKFYQLTADIDLSTYRWTPIGKSGFNVPGNEGSFQGYFDGNNRSIKGLNVDEDYTECYSGLFGVVAGSESNEQPIIQNLTLIDANVRIVTSSAEFFENRVGILVGEISSFANDKNTTFVKNVKVSGSIIEEDGIMIVGGMAGYSQFITYEDCSTDVIITNNKASGAAGGFIGVSDGSKMVRSESKGKLNGNYSIGGFIGIIYIGSEIENCISRVEVEGNDWNVGGFIGYSNQGTEVTNCVAYGNVKSNVTGWKPKVGGFVGTNTGTMTQCYAANTVTGSHPSIPAGGFMGFDEGIGTISSCSYDVLKNPTLSGIGDIGSIGGTSDITGKDSQKVLENVCDNVYGSHSYSSTWTTDTAATCTQEGSKSHHCERCDYKNDITVIPMVAHTVQKTEAVAATCTSKGNIEYWNCSVCSKYFSDAALATEITKAQTEISALGHTAQKVEAKAATCTSKGNIEYWHCNVCDKYFSDASLATEITKAQTEISVLGHTGQKVEAKAATCTSKGNIEYWHCSVCGKYFSDAALATEITKAQTEISALGHTAQKVAAKPATCTSKGNIEYWNCSVCDKYFSDAAFANEITKAQTEINKLGHNAQKTEAVAATCTSKGNIEYWNCSVCGKYFSDTAYKTEITLAQTEISALGHKAKKVEAKASTCVDKGNIEYWHCNVCDKYFSDAALSTEITKTQTEINKLGHTGQKVEAKAATCTSKGNIEHWHCSVCDKYFSDAALATEITKAQTEINKLGHNAQKTEAVAATCITKGNIEYWNCSVCGKYFSDAAYTNEITLVQTEISALGHKAKKVEAKASTCVDKGNIEYWYCNVCDKYFSDAVLSNEITKADTEINQLAAHTGQKVEAKDSTCAIKGNIECWNCSVCDKYFSDAALTNEITKEQTEIPLLAHTPKKVEAKDPTETEDGNIAYWYCEVCNKYFSDENLTNEISQSDTVIAATIKEPVKEGNGTVTTPSNQSKKNAPVKGAPTTADTSQVFIWVILLLATSIIALIVVKKERFK